MTLILQLDDSKAPGPTDIPTKILKIAAPVIVPQFKLINKSFELGVYPNSLKLAKVIPIFKAGSKLEVNNYRPISLLPTLSKIIEKLIHIRLFSFLEHSLIEKKLKKSEIACKIKTMAVSLLILKKHSTLSIFKAEPQPPNICRANITIVWV